MHVFAIRPVNLIYETTPMLHKVSNGIKGYVGGEAIRGVVDYP